MAEPAHAVRPASLRLKEFELTESKRSKPVRVADVGEVTDKGRILADAHGTAGDVDGALGAT
jgi:hypothetical protein